MKVIVVGAGGTGREVVRRLGAQWEVVLVDSDRARLDRAAELRSVEAIVGDGSSRVVLERAGIADTGALVAATPDDESNLEIVRLGQEAGVPRIVAVAGDPERTGDYTELGVAVFSPSRLAARNIEVELEPRRVNSTAFAAGKAEAVEVSIAPDAAVAGRLLRDLHSTTWVVAAILREGRLIVPHGSTALQPGDRVTVVGAATDYASIVETFTAGLSTFPLGFGRKVVVGYEGEEDRALVTEAGRLVRGSRAEVVMIVAGGGGVDAEAPLSDESASELAGDVEVEVVHAEGSVADTIREVSASQSVGVVVAAPGPSSVGLGRFAAARHLAGLGGGARLPLLLARNSTGYREIVVPARRTRSGEAAARAAIDLAVDTDTPLVAVAAVAPNFVATTVDTLEEANLAVAWLREEAAVHGLNVERRVRQGNPVRVIAAEVGPDTLLVMGSPQRPVGPLSMGVAALAATRVAGSSLLVPSRS